MDVVTLGAALSIMKKMPDTAASSAAAAEDAADRAEEAARTLTVDDTLSVAGRAADAKVTGDKIAGLNYSVMSPRIDGWIDGEYIKDTDGTVGQYASYHRTDYIPVNPALGKLLFHSRNSRGLDVKHNAWYDENKEFISSFSTMEDGTVAIQPPSNARYMRLSFNNTTINDVSAEYYVSAADLTKNQVFEASSGVQVATTTWEIGSRGADGNIESSNTEFVSSGIIKDAAIALIAPAYIGYLYLYNGNIYLGKIANGGTLDKVAGSWLTFTDGYIDIGYYLAKYGADSASICVKATGQTIADAQTFGDANILVYTSLNLTANRMTWSGISQYLRSKFVTHMSHNGNGTYSQSSTRNAIINPLRFDFDITITVETGYRFAVQYYDSFNIGADHLTYASGWITSTSSLTIPAGTYFCMIVAYVNDGNTNSATQDNLTFLANVTINDIYDKLLPTTPTDYMLNSAYVKTPILLSFLGFLDGVQSFCIYNGSYYSTDGEKLYVQGSNFSHTSETAIDLGHGNSLQLGSNGKAYASGWDDDKVYVVDLVTKEVNSSISLPVSGYTTCAVDDVNGYIFIFQRDSYPSTKTNYNFVVYDYVNNQIVSTKKITRPFGAMQACDFIDGKIFVLYGLGTNTIPNGYIILNTAGDIIAEYVISSQSTNEPEGVFVDRDTFEVYISFYNKKVYKVM